MSKNTGKFQMVLPFKSSGSSRSLSNYVESVASTSNSNSTTLDVDNVEKRGRKRQKSRTISPKITKEGPNANIARRMFLPEQMNQ